MTLMISFEKAFVERRKKSTKASNSSTFHLTTSFYTSMIPYRLWPHPTSDSIQHLSWAEA